MRSWSSRCASLWRSSHELLMALVVAVLVVMAVSGVCDQRDKANWQQGFAAGVASSGTPVAWGTCSQSGRSFRCAKTADGTLIEMGGP